ncbi:NAD(P)/FAD-dependent oxidoreductase [Streptomyces olivaceus]|uniref:NAD(P)/FAD-dependent oxidoreductase n=1 Tax=Streptomyces olivaceus TaxID=47716 RepID=UPI004057AA4B
MRQPSTTPARAIIIGGSLAGMLAAAAVRDCGGTVEILEAHELPEGPSPRVGVPQAAHYHVLLSGGADAIDELIPGTIKELIRQGAVRVPMTTNMVLLSPEGWYRRWKSDTHYLIAATRDLTDSVIRRRIADDPQVNFLPRVKAVALLGDRHRVTGVRIRSADGTETDRAADLVIDASGKGTGTPRRLAENLGISGLVSERIKSGLTYASRLYRAPVPTHNWPFVSIQADPRHLNTAKTGGILPVDGERWHVSLIGPPGAAPTANPDQFLSYARGLRHPIVADLLAHAEPLSDVAITHSTVNTRHYYERLDVWPDGLVAVGDSVAHFNPVYGHGMSVAALGALALRTQLESRGFTRGLARRVQKAVARPVELAWSLAVGQDKRYPGAEGTQNRHVDRLLQQYVSRLSRTATGSFHVATAMTDVLTLKAPSTSLLRPDVLAAAAIGPLRPLLSKPTFTARELGLLQGAGFEVGRAGTAQHQP